MLTAGLVFLTLVVLLRWYSLLRTIVWLRRHGPQFSQAVEALGPDEKYTMDAHEALYDAHGGKFIPFGVKSYRLRRALKRKGAISLVTRLPLRLVRLLWTFYVFMPACATFLIVLSYVPPILRPIDLWLLYAIGALLCVCAITVAAEGVVARLRLVGAWARHHYHFKDPALANFKVLAGSVIMAWVGAIGFLNYVAARFGGFGKIPDSDNWLERLIDSIRLGLGSLFLFGDPEPKLPIAGLTSLTLSLTGVAVFVILIGTFLADYDKLHQTGQEEPAQASSPDVGATPPGLAQAPAEPRTSPRGNTLRIYGSIGLAGIAVIVWKVLRYIT